MIISMVVMKRKVTKRVEVEKTRMKVMKKVVEKMVARKLVEIQVKLQDIVEKGNEKVYYRLEVKQRCVQSDVKKLLNR